MSNASKVSMGQKVAFGFGMLANQMFPAALGVFIIVLVKDLGFAALLWGIIQFAPRIFDAITDPIMGFISDNTKSKWGRRRQYVFIGGIIMGVAYIIMWQLFKENTLTYNFWYFFLWSLVFYLGLTIFSVPYVAMGYEMSDDFHERTKIMAIAQFIGQWAWVLAPWFWVVLYDQGGLHKEALAANLDWLANILPENGWFASPDSGVRELSIWVAIPCTIFAIIPALFIKTKSTLNRTDYLPINASQIKSSLSEIFKSSLEAFKIKQFKKIAVATFLVFNSFQVIASFTVLIIFYYIFNDSSEAGIWPAMHGCIGALITSFLIIPLVAFMSKKIGKKKAFILSQSISIIGYVLFWFLFIPGKPHLFLYALPFHSFGIGGLFTIMMSMTADVCDLDELETGKRREGVLGAVYWWMVKLGFGIAALLSGFILWIVGFDADNVTESAVTGMRLFYTLLPVAGVIGAILIMKDYDVTEKRAIEVRKELDKRKAEKQ
ncbi:MAG: MFS transporter [Polaribacter sp.]